jgi:hypothetical protein
MNRGQKVCLWIGLSLIAVLAIYPPYKADIRDVEINLGHRNIFTHVRLSYSTSDHEFSFGECMVYKKCPFYVDVPRLLLECFLIAAITTGGIWAFKDKRQESD